MQNDKGKFIVFEGIDGAGKSTQCDMLFNFISDLSIPSVRLAEPTSGEWGQRIRTMLQGDIHPPAEEQVEMFIMDRLDDYEKNIKPNLSDGVTIIMDRYFYSNAAYQGCPEISPAEIIHRNLEHGFPIPDRVYFIDISPGNAMERIRRRNNSSVSDIFEKQSFLEKVRENFFSLMDETFLVLDGMLDAGEISAIIKNDFMQL